VAAEREKLKRGELKRSEAAAQYGSARNAPDISDNASARLDRLASDAECEIKRKAIAKRSTTAQDE